MSRKLLAKVRKSTNKFWQANPKEKVDPKKLKAVMEKSWKECKPGIKSCEIYEWFLLVSKKKKRQRKGGKTIRKTY